MFYNFDDDFTWTINYVIDLHKAKLKYLNACTGVRLPNSCRNFNIWKNWLRLMSNKWLTKSCSFFFTHLIWIRLNIYSCSGFRHHTLINNKEYHFTTQITFEFLFLRSSLVVFLVSWFASLLFKRVFVYVFILTY